MLAMTILNLIRQVFTVGMKMVETENYNSKTLKEGFFWCTMFCQLLLYRRVTPCLSHTHTPFLIFKSYEFFQRI